MKARESNKFSSTHSLKIAYNNSKTQDKSIKPTENSVRVKHLPNHLNSEEKKISKNKTHPEYASQHAFIQNRKNSGLLFNKLLHAASKNKHPHVPHTRTLTQPSISKTTEIPWVREDSCSP